MGIYSSNWDWRILIASSVNLLNLVHSCLNAFVVARMSVFAYEREYATLRKQLVDLAYAGPT